MIDDPLLKSLLEMKETQIEPSVSSLEKLNYNKKLQDQKTELTKVTNKVSNQPTEEIPIKGIRGGAPVHKQKIIPLVNTKIKEAS